MTEADYLKEIGDVLNRYLIDKAAEITKDSQAGELESNLVIYAYQQMFKTKPEDEKYSETLDSYILVVFKYLWMRSGRSVELFNV